MMYMSIIASYFNSNNKVNFEKYECNVCNEYVRVAISSLLARHWEAEVAMHDFLADVRLKFCDNDILYYLEISIRGASREVCIAK